MFITKKKFEKMVQEEVTKREKEFDFRRSITDDINYLREDMNSRFRYVGQDINDLNQQISKIEKELRPELEEKCCCKNENVKYAIRY